MYLTDMANVLRSADLQVREYPGWKARGHGGMTSVVGQVWHHTATMTSVSTDTRILAEGRSDLPGPLSHLGLDREGVYHVIAAGGAYHAGSGSWPGIPINRANHNTIGTECFHRGTSAEGGWKPKMLDSLRRGTAALNEHYGLPSSTTIGHKEWAPTRKIDPFGLSMSTQRAIVKSLMSDNKEPPMAEWKNEYAEKAAERLLATGVFSQHTTPGKVVETDTLAIFLDRVISAAMSLVRVNNTKSVYQLVGRNAIPVTSETQAKVLVEAYGGDPDQWLRYVSSISADDFGTFKVLDIPDSNELVRFKDLPEPTDPPETPEMPAVDMIKGMIGEAVDIHSGNPDAHHD